MDNFINKSRSSVVFADYPELLCTTEVLGDGIINLSFNGEQTQRIASALGDVLSPNFYIQSSVSIDLLKTSSQYQEFLKKRKNSNILTGIATITLDDGSTYKMFNMTFEIGSVSGDGSSATVEVVVNGNVRVNQLLLV